MTDSVAALKARIEALEEANAFLAMYYTLRVAERLDEWRKGHEECNEKEDAAAMYLAYKRVMQMAKEYHDKSPVGLGDIT